MALTASSTPPASPDLEQAPSSDGRPAEQLVVVHDQHPRLAHWRSSSTSSTSVPPPGARHPRAAAVALHAADDRLAHPRRSPGTAAVEPGAAVADEHLRAPRAALGVDVHGRAAAELRRVRHRLRAAATIASWRRRGRGRRPRPPRPAPRSSPPRPRRRPRARPRAERPGLVLALPASQARSSRSCRRAMAATSFGIAGAALDHRERLEDGVVQVRGHPARSCERMRCARSCQRVRPAARPRARRSRPAPPPWRPARAARRAPRRARRWPGGTRSPPRSRARCRCRSGDRGGRAAALGHGGLRSGAGRPGRRPPPRTVRGARSGRRATAATAARRRSRSARAATRLRRRTRFRAPEREQRGQQQQPGSERHLHGRAAGGQLGCEPSPTRPTGSGSSRAGRRPARTRPPRWPPRTRGAPARRRCRSVARCRRHAADPAGVAVAAKDVLGGAARARRHA